MSAEVITETQQRFLRAILEQIPLERMAELHRFAPIRQGGSETGLAVFVTFPEEPSVEGVADVAEPEVDSATNDVESADTPARPARVRHTVYTARYHLVLKGPDRGSWELDIREEADAPLVTVDAVVRGVQRRTGDMAEVERMTPEQLAVAVSNTPWQGSE